MTKKEFLQQLRSLLSGLSQEDIQSSLDYYGEMIDDRVESGMSEQEATAELGAPQNIAHDILLEMPLPKVIKSKCNRKRTWKAWEIVLLAVGSPVWLSLLVALVVVILASYAVLWVVIGALWISDAAIFASSILLFITTFGAPPMMVLLICGAGLAFIGLSVLMFFGCLKLTVLFAKLSIMITKGIKHLIIGKNNKREEV